MVSAPVAALVALTLAAVAGLAIWFVMLRKRPTPASASPSAAPLVPNETAAPPPRKPSASDQILARAINAVNHDMRSLELGGWLASRLGAALSKVPGGDPCAPGARVDFGFLNALPGASALTKSELRGHLQALLKDACRRAALAGGGATALTALRDSVRDALDPATGTLVGMPGYSVLSRVKLP